MLEFRKKIEVPNLEIKSEGNGKGQEAPAENPNKKGSDAGEQRKTSENGEVTKKEGGEHKEGHNEEGKQEAAGI